MLLTRMRPLVRNVPAYALLTVIAVSASLLAQTHVVSPTDLRKEAASASDARRHNLETVNGFLSSPRAQDVLGKTGIDPAQVRTAIAALNDQELAQLAARSEKAQADFAAGRLSDRDLIIVLIGIAALILIIVAVR